MTANYASHYGLFMALLDKRERKQQQTVVRKQLTIKWQRRFSYKSEVSRLQSLKRTLTNLHSLTDNNQKAIISQSMIPFTRLQPLHIFNCSSNHEVNDV